MPWESVKCFLKITQRYKVLYKQGPYLHLNRNGLIQIARYENESLLFIDSDMVFEPYHVEKIEQYLENYDAVTGLYAFGQPPHEPVIFKKIGTRYESCPAPEGFSQIDACGAGFLGLSKNIIQQLPDKPCNPLQVSDDELHEEDLALCCRINQIGKLFCDPDMRIGHLRTDIKYP